MKQCRFFVYLSLPLIGDLKYYHYLEAYEKILLLKYVLYSS